MYSIPWGPVDSNKLPWRSFSIYTSIATSWIIQSVYQTKNECMPPSAGWVIAIIFLGFSGSKKKLHLKIPIKLLFFWPQFSLILVFRWNMEQAICDKKHFTFDLPLYLHISSTRAPLFGWQRPSCKSIQGELRCNAIMPPDFSLIFFFIFFFVSGSLISHQRAFKKCVRGKWQSPMIDPAWLRWRLSASSCIRTQLLTAYPTAALKGRSAFQCKTTDTMAAIYFSDRTIYGAITINHCRGKEDCLTHPEPPYKCNSPTA